MAGWIRLFGCIFAIPEKAVHRHVLAAHCMTPSKQSVKVDPCLRLKDGTGGQQHGQLGLPGCPKERDLPSSHKMLSFEGS